jgi:predicted RNA-binding Zn ribbon-like protein
VKQNVSLPVTSVNRYTRKTMPTPRRRSPATSPVRLPFSWSGGDPSVDFTNTVAWTARGLAEERLLAYRDLVDWAAGSGLVARPALLLRAAAGDAASAAATLGAALELRRALHRLFVARAAGRRPPQRALATLERWVADAVARRRLTATAEGLRWEWSDDRELAAPLRRVAHAGAHLLTGDDAARLKLCSNPQCGWTFVDRSRRGNRRWCEMAVCGSRDKARRYYRRHRSPAATAGRRARSDS